MKPGRQCVAHTKRGQCLKAAIRGGTVCPTHGGSVKRVKRKAAERLADLIDPDRALREAARLAYSDIGELYDSDGQLKPVKDWPPHIRAAVSGIETTKRNLTAGDGKQEEVIRVRLWDKPKNLEMLFKHLGLLKEQMEHTGKVTLIHELP